MDLEFNVDDFQGGRYSADRGVHARFFTLPVEDRAKSAEAGRPIFRDAEYVEIVAAGNANNIITRPASSEDKQRFRRQYEAYKQGAEDQTIGTPLTQVPWVTRSQVEELAYLKIRTLEALAGVDDNICGRTVGLYDLKRRAIDAMAAADSAAPVLALREANDKLQNEVDTLKNQLKELAAAAKKSG